MIETDNLYNMDCIEGMKLMADDSVDAVIADLPYGVLSRRNGSAEWDKQIPLEPLWEQYRRITKPEVRLFYLRKAFSPHGSCCRNHGCGGIILYGGRPCDRSSETPSGCRYASTRTSSCSMIGNRCIIRR